MKLLTLPNELGFIAWFGDTVKTFVPGTGLVWAFVVLGRVYFYSHYFFASNTAHVSSMYLPFLTIAIALGTLPFWQHWSSFFLVICSVA